ncbi:TonB-dependent siderophore receptor [Pseudoxanthomonas sp. PXM01]|uniref:TonB-dependent siderophore receptor n=1 Tax=Pseudoxanthomonas sp. PXM01 TaxID=2769295 RepID=UPI0017839969|nr:TonB-dependent siderophore receptor [Pseudoxanthomonas sp. PXM01]MBD9468115.1 TonB-dependent siderophore receptor [Pseudoxanthomonas sp. PXM01]
MTRTASFRSLSLAIAVALATPGLALAQSAADDATTLDAVQVQAPIPKDTGTATKTATSLKEIPQSISVITSRHLQDRGVHGVEEAVWFTAGAQGGAYGSDSRSDWLLVRGFTPARYMDGLALPEGSGTGITRIEPYGLEQIEVLKGPASVNYGAMPPGGLVNYVSKRPTEDTLREVEVQVGSDDLRQVALDFGGKLNESGTLLYRLTALGRNSDTPVDYIHDDRYYFAPAITWKPDEANELTVLARYQKADTKAGAGFLPAAGTLHPNPNGRISPSLYTGEPNANDYIKTLKSLGYEFRHDFGGGVVFNQSARLMDSEVEPSITVGTFGLLPDQRTLSRYLWSTREDEKTFGLDNNLQWKFSTGRAEHTLLAGLDYRRGQWNYDSNFVFAATGLDAYNPVYGSMPNLAPTFDPVTTASTRQTQKQLGLYVQDQIKLDRWVFTVGGRQDWVGTDTSGGHQSDDKFSARVGVNYVFDNGLAPYVGWSQSFQPTMGADFFGRAFEPTTGEQVEAGLKYQPANGKVLATLALYEVTQENTLTIDPDPTHPLFQIQQGETKVRGVELEGRWNIGRGLSVYGAYAYIDSEVTKSNDLATLGKQIALQPKHSASAGGDYTITSGALSGLGFGAGVRYTGKHYGDAPNLWETPSYTLFDAAVHYDFSNWRFQLNVQNVGDKEYISACNAVYWCYYGYERSVTATARYVW